MLKLAWLLLAHGTAIDRDTNSMTIFSTFSRIKAESLPLMIPQASMAALLQREKADPAKGSLVFRIVHNDEEQFRGIVDYDFGESLSNQLAVGLRGLIVPGPGEMAFRIYSGTKLLGEFKLGVEGPKVDTPAQYVPIGALSKSDKSFEVEAKPKSRKKSTARPKSKRKL